MYVLDLFTELTVSDPRLVQMVSRKLCTVITIIFMWCILVVSILKMCLKIKKELTFISIAFYLVIFFLGLITVLFLCKIQLFVCQFLPIICI